MIERGEPDAALAKLAEAAPDAESLYLQGAAWARKAETAPLPTPPPRGSPGPQAAQPSPEFKEEELTALELLEQAVATQPSHASAQLAIAELLAPHATRLHERAQAGQKAASRRGRRAAPATAPTPEPRGPDYGAERVIAAYRAALQGDPAAKAPAEGLARFCLRIGRLDDAEAALQELIRRDKENPEHLVRYGDFLAQRRDDRMGAVDQYRQALIWRPGDDDARGKVADIFIAMGIEHFLKQEYGVAEARFVEAEKYVSDRGAPRGIKIQDYLGRLRSIRPKAGR